MFNLLRLSRAPRPDRAALLAAVPQRNSLARESARTGNSLRLTAPLRPSALRSFLTKAPSEKSFDLDDLGIWTWDRIDGRTSVGTLIEIFAAAHHLNLREAEVSLLAFLKMLTQRNLIALAAPRTRRERVKKRRKNSQRGK